MSKSKAIANPEREFAKEIACTLDTQKPIKPANIRRGAEYREDAQDFIKRWKVGDHLSWHDFCHWAYGRGLLKELPPHVEDKQSKEWLAHLQLRHQARANLNKAAAHPSMINTGGAFFLDASGGSLWVRSTRDQIMQGGLTEAIGSLAGTKRKQLEYLMQSTDWAQLEPSLRFTIEDLKDDLDSWIISVEHASQRMDQRIRKLSKRLKQLTETQNLKSLNGGIAGLIESNLSE